ncbi:MAG: hypothetical protein VB035_09560 [Candidatus Fimivivens sp.]|nr:hypothetical protein [Candidatus Fimivivens sp.]
MTTVGNGAQGFAITAEDSALTDETGYFEQDESEEGTAMVDEALRETLTLLVQIAATDKEDEQQSLLEQLYDLQEKNNDLLEQTGMKVAKFSDGKFGVIPDSTTNEVNLEGQGNNGNLSQDIIFDLVELAGLLVPGPIGVTASISSYIIGHRKELLDEERAMEARSKAKQEFLYKVKEGTATKEDFKKYGDNAYWRKKWLAYIYDKDRLYFDQEIAIAGPDPYISFSDAEKKGKEKRLPVPQPTIYGELKVQHSQLPSELYSDRLSLLNSDEDVRNSLLSDLGIPPRSEENQPTRIYISNGSVEDVAKSETEPDSNMISNWQNDGLIPTIKTPSQIMTFQFSHNLINPQTGGEGALDTAAVNTSPYQMDGLGTDSNGTLNAQDGFSERLAAALEKLAEVCALPRVSVGTLAETAVVREEADLDTLARRLAGELLHAQMVS